MTLNEYQSEALKTAFYPSDTGLIYTALKLTGEAGEINEKIGKMMRDEGWKIDEPASLKHRIELARELADVLWYVAAMSYELGFQLHDIATIGINKLQDRQKRGVLGGSGDNR